MYAASPFMYAFRKMPTERQPRARVSALARGLFCVLLPRYMLIGRCDPFTKSLIINYTKKQLKSHDQCH